MNEPTTHDGGGAPAVPMRQVAAVAVGNALEFYDFLTFAFFALQIGHTFFPAQSASSSLLLSLATFGAGFLTRPLGGYVIGRMGDRVGRKPAMMLSFGLMGIAIFGIALTPSYASIGIAAPVLLVLWRLLQGFALGGEVGPSTAFLLEIAPPGKRGLYSSLQSTSQNVAKLAAGVVGFLLTSFLGAQALDQWGWRIAFLVGAAIVPLGLVIRRSLPETLHASPISLPQSVAAAAAANPRYTRIAVLGFIMLACATTQTYVQLYFTTYAQATLHMSASAAFAASIISNLCGAAVCPIAGALSDRFGRRPLMIAGTLLLGAGTLPAFFIVNQLRTPAALYVVTALLAMVSAAFQPTILTAITEALPRNVRSGALGLVYALAITIFGGSTQFIIAWLTGVTGNPLSPGWYMAASALIGFGAMVMMRETAPRVLARGRGSPAAAPSGLTPGEGR
jgi:MFS family permease